jgi:hypothetical protein
MDVTGECHLLFVPVRESGSGVLALRTGRLPSGQRVGLAYTSAAALLSALGPGQPWIRLHEDAIRDMLQPAGIDQIRVDACLSPPPGRPAATEPAATEPAAAEPAAAEPGHPQAGPQHPPVTVPPRRRGVPYRCASLRAAPGRHQQPHTQAGSTRT